MHGVDLHTPSKKTEGGMRPMKATADVGPAMDAAFMAGEQGDDAPPPAPPPPPRRASLLHLRTLAVSHAAQLSRDVYHHPRPLSAPPPASPAIPLGRRPGSSRTSRRRPRRRRRRPAVHPRERTRRVRRGVPTDRRVPRRRGTRERSAHVLRPRVRTRTRRGVVGVGVSRPESGGVRLETKGRVRRVRARVRRLRRRGRRGSASSRG